METKGNDKANITLQLTLAGALLSLLFLLLFAVVNARIPERNDAAFNILLGNVMGWIGALVAFSFPSNIGNAKKDDTINRLSASASAPLTETTTRTLEASDDTRGKGQSTSGPSLRGGDQVGGGPSPTFYEPEPISPGQWDGGHFSPDDPTLPSLPPGKRGAASSVG